MPDVTLTRHGSVALLRLDDGKANAFRASTIGGIHEALDAASDARAVVFLGRPGFFSGGLDLKVLPVLPPDEKRKVIADFSQLMLRVWSLGRPTVAAITGHAIAGGALLALACDVRLAVDGPQKFGVTEVPLGIAMPRFGVEICRAAMSGATLAEALLHGRVYTLTEARDRGIVASLHSAEELEAAALACAARLALLPPGAYEGTKVRLRGDAHDAAQAALAGEMEGFMAAFTGG